MVAERCTWSGGQAKGLVEGVVSNVQLQAVGHVAAIGAEHPEIRFRAWLAGGVSELELALA